MTDETKDTTVDETAGLKAKVKELHGIIKTLQTEKDTEQAAREEAETEAATKAGDVDKIRTQLEAKHKKEVDGLKAQLDTVSNDLKSIRVDAEIASAIAKGNVITDHVEAVEALLHRKVQYEDGVATIDGQPIADFTKTYFAKAGAVYVNAPNNNGAGTQGNDGTKANAYADIKSAEDITPELMKLAETDPAQYNSIVEQAGLGFLRV